MRAGLAALALAGASWSHSALAQMPSDALPAPYTAAQAITLCPGLDGNPDAFAMAREQGDGALKAIGTRARSLGLDGEQAIYTSWSGKLAAMEFYRDVPSGEALGQWRAPLDAALVADGWEPVEDVSFGFGAPGYLKTVATENGSRDYLIEIDLHGNRRGITLRCGDAGLLKLDADERDGLLAPGSPRPLAPAAGPGLEEFLARLDCTDGELLALFARNDSIEQAGAIAEAKLGPAPDIFAASEYQARLVTWLKWTMIRSGKADDEVIWAIEDRIAAADRKDYEGDLMAFVGALGSVAEAGKSKDPAALCRSFTNMMRLTAKNAEDEARRDAALAAALTQEAHRRGIAID